MALKKFVVLQVYPVRRHCFVWAQNAPAACNKYQRPAPDLVWEERMRIDEADLFVTSLEVVRYFKLVPR